MAELVQHTIGHQLHESQQAADDENHLPYKEWLKQGQAKGAGPKGSPPLSEFFKKKNDANSQSEGEHKQPRQTTEHEPAASTRPTPRRLHFPTALDDRDGESTSPQGDQQEAHDNDNSDAEGPNYVTVDFF